jgi:hypothetical protein
MGKPKVEIFISLFIYEKKNVLAYRSEIVTFE